MYDRYDCGDVAAGAGAPAGFCASGSLGFAQALAVEAPALKLVAPVGAGKTEFLIQKAKQLVDQGVEPGRILMAVLTPDAAAAAAARLAGHDERLAGVRVVPVFELACEILKTAEARAFTGRPPRMLLPAEAGMLAEDLKSVGLDERALKRLLARVAGRLLDEGPLDTLAAKGDERALVDAMRSWLAHVGGMLREEVAPLAEAFLCSAGGLAETARYDAVLVDDFQNLSAASQRMVCLLGGGRLVVAGNPNQAREGFERRPCPRGFESFELTLRPGAPVLRLAAGPHKPAGVTALCDALSGQDGMRADALSPKRRAVPRGARDVVLLKWREPADEFEGLATIVRRLAGTGVVSDGADVFVAAPSRAWAVGMARALEKLNVPAVVSFEGDGLAGDPRRPEAWGALASYAALALAADPDDAVAWRLWLGLGDAQLRTQAWLSFVAWSQGLGLSAAMGLRRLASEGGEIFAGANELRKRYREGLEAAGRLAARRGFALAKAASRDAGCAFAAMLEPVEGAETPGELVDRLRARALAPAFAPGNRDVKIVSYGRLAGLNPRVLVMGGLMDGLVPSGSHAARMRVAPEPVRARALEALLRERRVFYDAVGKAGQTLYLSYVQRADEPLARVLGADIRRTRVELGRTLAVLAPCAFLDEAGDALPPTVSGEQYLAALERGPACRT